MGDARTRVLPGRVTLVGRTLREHAARGTLVTAAFHVGVQSLGLVRGFVVAAFLTTTEYGVWGVLVVGLGTLVWLKQVGVSDKYVQQDEPDQELAFQRAFTMEALATGALVLLALIAVPLLAALYGDEVLAPGLVCVLALPAVVLQSPLWVFYRRLQFVRQRALEAVEPLVTTVVTIALAVAGAGYWSPVAGLVVGMWAGALAAVIASPYRLAFRFDRATLRDYARFSWPLFVASAGGIVIAQGSVIAGDVALGLAGVGAIALASTIALYAERVDAIVTQTLYPAIAAVKDRTDVLFESFVKSNRLALMWGVPFGIGLTLFAPDLVEYGIGEEWEPAVGLLQAFGVLAAVNHVGFNWTAYYRARGETRPLAVATVVAMVAFLIAAVPLLLVAELDGYAAGMAVVTLASVSVRFVYLRRLFPGLAIARHTLRAAAPTLPAVTVVLLPRLLEGERTAAIAAAELTAYVVVTALATALLERRLLSEVAGYLRRRPSTDRPTSTEGASAA